MCFLAATALLGCGGQATAHPVRSGEPPARARDSAPAVPLQAAKHETIEASKLSASDGCELDLHCDAGDVRVTCEGANDGTDTSACNCHWRDTSFPIGGTFSGEGAQACHAAGTACVSAVDRALQDIELQREAW
jgi:hypothetical protein